MKIFLQYFTKLKGKILTIDYRRLFPIALVTVLLFLSYTFRQCQFISSGILPSFGQSSNQTPPSSSPARSQLTKLIVVSHYNEDLDWLNLFISDRIPYIVYTRSSDSLIRYSIPINKGREAVAYLRYIVDHYSKLPSLIAFIHGHRTAWHQTDPTDTAIALRALRWNKYNYMPLTSTMTRAAFIANGPDLQSAVNFQVWRDVLQKELGPPPTGGIKTHCCASFVVRRESILKHSKEFYSKIIDYMVNSTHSDHLTGRSLEYTWHIIFGEPAVLQYKPCDLFFCDEKGAISVKLAENK